MNNNTLNILLTPSSLKVMESSIYLQFLSHSDLPRVNRIEFYRHNCLGYLDIIQ